jgi:hypothetical protein
MELWRGPVNDFIGSARVGSLGPAMLQSFYVLHGHQPAESEVRRGTFLRDRTRGGDSDGHRPTFVLVPR